MTFAFERPRRIVMAILWFRQRAAVCDWKKLTSFTLEVAMGRHGCLSMAVKPESGMPAERRAIGTADIF